MGRNRISVFRPALASIVVLSLFGVSHGYYNGNQNNIGVNINPQLVRRGNREVSGMGVVPLPSPGPGVYSQGLSNNPNNQQQFQYQPQPQQQPQAQQYYQKPQLQHLQQIPLQSQPSILVPRLGRSYQSMGRARNDDEEEEYLDQDLQEDDHEPTEHSPKKKKKASKKKEELSFPRRMMKKTTSVFRNTAGAVFGAPKYIFTRYRDTYGFGKKKAPEKKKSKGKGKGKGHDEKGWGWDQHEQHDEGNHGWGWDARAGEAGPDEYERKNGDRYNYKRYLYNQPGSGARESRPTGALSSLYAWTG